MRKKSARSQSFIIEFLKFLVFWSVKVVIKKAILLWVLRTQGHVSTNMSFTNKLLKRIVCFRRKNMKNSKNIVKKCDDNNYI